MGNMQCPAEDAAHLASVARDICPFPDYNPSPLFVNMVSIDSSRHLRNHYRAVQSSLTPQQLEDFTQGLRTTFGREGKVTLGGVGIVALSLAVLFDTLASQARGQWVPESGPIPRLFLKDPRGFYPPQVHTASEYLRLVPYIANNPTRMREESERYLKQLIIDGESLDKLRQHKTSARISDITAVNEMLGYYFGKSLKIHLDRIKNVTTLDLRETRRKVDLTFNLNCDPEKAGRELLAEVQKSDSRTQEAFRSCFRDRRYDEGTLLLRIARLVLVDASFVPGHAMVGQDSLVAQREDFDLKADALGKWV